MKNILQFVLSQSVNSVAGAAKASAQSIYVYAKQTRAARIGKEFFLAGAITEKDINEVMDEFTRELAENAKPAQFEDRIITMIAMVEDGEGEYVDSFLVRITRLPTLLPNAAALATEVLKQRKQERELHLSLAGQIKAFATGIRKQIKEFDTDMFVNSIRTKYPDLEKFKAMAPDTMILFPPWDAPSNRLGYTAPVTETSTYLSNIAVAAYTDLVDRICRDCNVDASIFFSWICCIHNKPDAIVEVNELIEEACRLLNEASLKMNRFKNQPPTTKV